MCNSAHSRLFGFFQCLPGIWRAFQCLRRFADTRNVYPHLVNFGKYLFTILYYATLSMYRIDMATRFQATFITFALLYAIYTSIWDLANDWSLGNPYAKHRFLREVLAFRNVWVYYVAMVVDVIVRFNWIYYAIFTHHIGHSAVMSFVVSFSEVCRRGMWSIFRVENEHCTNVLLFRASRDVPLPYELNASIVQTTDGAPSQGTEAMQLRGQPASRPSTAEPSRRDVEQARPGLRTRSQSIAGGFSRVGTMVASAHAQDFQRRKDPAPVYGTTTSHNPTHTPDDTSEEEDDDGGLQAPYHDDPAEELPFTNSQARHISEEPAPPTTR